MTKLKKRVRRLVTIDGRQAVIEIGLSDGIHSRAFVDRSSDYPYVAVYPIRARQSHLHRVLARDLFYRYLATKESQHE